MRGMLILPALAEARLPGWRPVKYALFPPLGLATLAAFLDPGDDACIEDGHVTALSDPGDAELVLIEVYITNARRAYALADRYRAAGAHVCLGGLHVTSLPDEARAHADTIFLGPAEQTFPAFLRDYRAGAARPRYVSTAGRTLLGTPPPRRDLIDRRRYLVPNSIVVSRGCPHRCDFCYKEAFLAGGRGFYTRAVDDALAEIAALPGRHLYVLDDHLLGHRPFATPLFDGMRGMGRRFQGAATVDSVLRGDLIERAAAAGLRSLFVGFETFSPENLAACNKKQNLARDYAAAVRRLQGLGIMVNGSFVFGMDDDGPDVFARTVDWAVRHGVTTATFHIQTPYPGTALHARLAAQGRILKRDWDLYDTRHAVYRPARMTPAALEAGYRRAYRDFYGWGAIARAAAAQPTMGAALRHAAYATGWKKAAPVWNALIRSGALGRARPALEWVLGRPGDPPGPSAAVGRSQARSHV